MGRVLLVYLLPLLGPILVYLGWLHFTGRRTFEAAADLGATLQERSSLWVLIASVALTAASLLLFTHLERSSPGGVYQAPRFEDGVIVPSYVVPAEQ
jgi:hypothetical protein